MSGISTLVAAPLGEMFTLAHPLPGRGAATNPEHPTAPVVTHTPDGNFHSMLAAAGERQLNPDGHPLAMLIASQPQGTPPDAAPYLEVSAHLMSPLEPEPADPQPTVTIPALPGTKTGQDSSPSLAPAIPHTGQQPPQRHALMPRPAEAIPSPQKTSEESTDISHAPGAHHQKEASTPREEEKHAVADEVPTTSLPLSPTPSAPPAAVLPSVSEPALTLLPAVNEGSLVSPPVATEKSIAGLTPPLPRSPETAVEDLPPSLPPPAGSSGLGQSPPPHQRESSPLGARSLDFEQQGSSSSVELSSLPRDNTSTVQASDSAATTDGEPLRVTTELKLTATAPGMSDGVRETAPTLSRSAPPVATLTPPLTSPVWSQHLGDQLVKLVRNGDNRVSLQLNPAELGPLVVDIVQQGDHEVHLQLVAASPAARSAAEQAIPQLRESLAEQGITLGQATVGEQGSRRSFAEQPGSPLQRSHTTDVEDDASHQALSTALATGRVSIYV